MIDFTKCIEVLNCYKGSEKKKTLIYDGKKYLVKFPDPIIKKDKSVSYINNAFSEYIGSNIFKIIGFKTQNTILGTYKNNKKEKIVCACEDFTDENSILYEFGNLALSTNMDKKIETELTDIVEVIETNSTINNTNIKENFFDMFIVDSLIGNTDRHNGNWGIILNKEKMEVSFSHIYDCGLCLNPILEDKEIENLNSTEIKNLAINSHSCIKENGKKINYMSYISSMKNEDCNRAIKRIFPSIDLEKINLFIENIDCISTYRKEFYKGLIKIRYSIIKETYNKIK